MTQSPLQATVQKKRGRHNAESLKCSLPQQPCDPEVVAKAPAVIYEANNYGPRCRAPQLPGVNITSRLENTDSQSSQAQPPTRRLIMSLIRSKRSDKFEQKYLSVAELATRWSVSPSAIYSRKCGTSALSPIRFGKSIRFLRTEVEAFERDREARASKAQTSIHNDRPARADLAA